MTEHLNENLTKEQMKETLGDLADYMAKTFPDWNAYCQAVQIFTEHGRLQKQLATVTAEKKELLSVLWQMLDDMSTGGHSVCPAAKKDGVAAYNRISPELHDGYLEGYIDEQEGSSLATIEALKEVGG